MTDMQLIVPRLEDNQDQGVESDYGPNGKDKDEDTTVLSNELRDEFETMKTAWRRARRSSGDNAEELRRKEQDAALDTAVAIESEMKMWQNGIAELEAMLAEEDDGEDYDEEVQARPQEFVRFPSLPPVIPADEEDVDQNTESGDEKASIPTTDL
jgi:hypothetical protein